MRTAGILAFAVALALFPLASATPVEPAQQVRQDVWVQPSWSKPGNMYEPGETAELTVQAQPVHAIFDGSIRGPWVATGETSVSVHTLDDEPALQLTWNQEARNEHIWWYQAHEPFLPDLSSADSISFKVYSERPEDDLRFVLQNAPQQPVEFIETSVGDLEPGWNDVTIPLDVGRDQIVKLGFRALPWSREKTFFVKDIEFAGLTFESPTGDAQLQTVLTDHSGETIDQFSTDLSPAQLHGRADVTVEVPLPEERQGLFYAELTVTQGDSELGWNRVPLGVTDTWVDVEGDPPDNRMGVVAHLSNAIEGDPVLRAEIAKMTGASRLRTNLATTTNQPGVYDWTASDLIENTVHDLGIDRVVTNTPPDWAFDAETLAVDTAAYADYVDAVTTRYPWLHVWELGNEANLSAMWRENQQEWVQYIADMYGVLKSRDPAFTVVNGGLGYQGLRDGWIEEVFDLGLGDHIDGLALHLYGFIADELPQAKQIMADHGYPDMDIWLTETAINYYNNDGSVFRRSRHAMANNLVDWFMVGAKEDLQLYSWYELADGAFGNHFGLRKKSLGLFEFDGTNFAPKETAMAYNTLATMFAGYDFDSFSRNEELNNLTTYRFVNGDDPGSTLTAIRADEPTTIEMHADGTVSHFDIYGNEEVLVPDDQGKIAITATSDYGYVTDVETEAADSVAALNRAV